MALCRGLSLVRRDVMAKEGVPYQGGHPSLHLLLFEVSQGLISGAFLHVSEPFSLDPSISTNCVTSLP